MDCSCPVGWAPSFTRQWLDDYIKLKATCGVLHELETLQACLQRHGELG